MAFARKSDMEDNVIDTLSGMTSKDILNIFQVITD